jgi:hypothetical protein
MKTLSFAICILLSSGLDAQHPLVGTWEMISGTGTGADGEKFSIDTTTSREIKIITPTHYMLINWDVQGDSLTFNRSMAGTVRLDGDKYIEVPTQASVQIFDDIKVDFRWKLEGDTFIQSGTIVRPDGKKITLDGLVFRRVTNAKSNPKNPGIGTWNQLSAQYTPQGGKTIAAFAAGDQGQLFVTPTHWMRINHKNKKFDNVMYGTYSMKGETVTTIMEYATFPFTKGAEQAFQQKVSENRIHTVGSMTLDGKRAVFESVFQKIP